MRTSKRGDIVINILILHDRFEGCSPLGLGHNIYRKKINETVIDERSISKRKIRTKNERRY